MYIYGWPYGYYDWWYAIFIVPFVAFVWFIWWLVGY